MSEESAQWLKNSTKSSTSAGSMCKICKKKMYQSHKRHYELDYLNFYYLNIQVHEHCSTVPLFVVLFALSEQNLIPQLCPDKRGFAGVDECQLYVY